MREHEIEILRVGKFTSKDGVELEVKSSDLNDVVQAYDPKNFQAPLIISHDTKGIPDKKLVNTKFAYGAPKLLKRVGDRVRAVFDKVDSSFLDWVRKGNLLSISPSLYLPKSPNNPAPGKLSLRHIAALGAEPPAIKGLAPMAQTLALSEIPAVAFAEEEEGALSLDFSASDSYIDLCGMADRTVATLFQSIREWLIEFKGMDLADRIVPSYSVGMLQENSSQPGLWERIDYLTDRVARLEANLSTSPNYSEGTMGTEATETTQTPDFSEKERELAERERKIALREFASFCDSELKGKLVPAIAPNSEVAEFMAWVDQQQNGEISFSEEKTQAPLEWFKGFLQRLPQQVEFKEAAPSGDFKDPDKQEADTADMQAKKAYEGAWKSKAMKEEED